MSFARSNLQPVSRKETLGVNTAQRRSHVSPGEAVAAQEHASQRESRRGPEV